MKINFENLIKQNLEKNIPKQKKILITGCSGFIGQYILEALSVVNIRKQNIIHGIDVIRPKQKIKNFIF